MTAPTPDFTAIDTLRFDNRITRALGVEIPITLRWLDTANQDIWQNLALTSIGGLLSSTLLIILVMPALYYVSVRFGWLLRHLWLWLGSLRPPRRSAEAA